MQKAKQIVLNLGGAEKCNTFTRFFFAALGQISYDACPCIPPEIVLLPKWFYFNLYHVSAWTRTMILPLGIVTTFRYTRHWPLRNDQRIDELYIDREVANRLSPEPLAGTSTILWPAPFDVASESAVVGGIADIERAHGPIDGLVNAAGVFGKMHAAARVRMENWDREINIDLRGTFLVARSVGTVLRRAGEPLEGFRALFVMNQEDGGFDCPGCAWPDDPSGLRLAICENGVKHVTWELADAKNQPIRRYFGGKGAKGGVDTWCYFKDGVEVYREIDTKNTGAPDQFRWLNAGGLKWGMDRAGRGKIDSWRIIAAEEVGFEAFQAVATNDYARLQALFITADEMQALEPEHKRSRRHHPKIDAPQAWYYRQEYGDAGEVFICLHNAAGQASRRVFDMATGRLIGDILIREGNFRDAFPEDITGAVRLNGNWAEAEMETWGTEMPMTALDSLHVDLEAAQYEMKSRTSPKSGAPAAVPSEQAAS